MEEEQLVILGNGFDLALGQKTSYADFFEWLETEDTISTIPRLNFQTLNVAVEQTIDVVQTKDKILNDLKTKKVNIWVYYFCQLDHKLEGWNNVESVIKKVVGYTEAGINYPSNTSIKMYLNGARYRSNNILINLIILLAQDIKNCDNDDGFSEYNSPLLNLKNSDKKFFPFLYDELIKFENLFMDYLSSDCYFSESSHRYTYKELLQNMDVNTSSNGYHILDFNYTLLSDIDDNVNNIHGTVHDKNIIFGIDATKVDAKYPHYQFTKESRIMHNSLKPTLGKKKADILNKNIKKIKFFGHSLAEADYAYFQSIFDYLNIYDSNVILIFCYGKYLSIHKEELSEYEHQIQKLLSIYGTTLDNKDHGKNIMTKLMLENRLQIKEIDSFY